MKMAAVRLLFSMTLIVLLTSCYTMGQTPRDSVRGADRLTGRDFLLPNETEAVDFGLYSYLIFARPVDQSNRERYLAVAKAYLTIPSIQRFEELGVDQSELNITYLPIVEEPPSEPSASWLVDHYNYAHAQVLVRSIDVRRAPGPIIISYFEPLTHTAAVDTSRLLYQDLSSVPADLVYLWVQDFIEQAGRPQYWDQNALTRLMLDLRTSIAVSARAFKEVVAVHSSVTSLFNKTIRIYE